MSEHRGSCSVKRPGRSGPCPHQAISLYVSMVSVEVIKICPSWSAQTVAMMSESAVEAKKRAPCRRDDRGGQRGKVMVAEDRDKDKVKTELW